MAGGTRSALTDEFWRGYRKAAGLQHDDYDAVAFGDGPKMATELAELVVAGTKRATAGLVHQFGPDGEAALVVGGYVVLLDGANRPRAIWRTTEVRTGPLNSVDERFAWDEGEGERTREWWLAAPSPVLRAESRRSRFSGARRDRNHVRAIRDRMASRNSRHQPAACRRHRKIKTPPGIGRRSDSKCRGR